jgi:hypothetical protein
MELQEKFKKILFNNSKYFTYSGFGENIIEFKIDIELFVNLCAVACLGEQIELWFHFKEFREDDGEIDKNIIKLKQQIKQLTNGTI